MAFQSRELGPGVEYPGRNNKSLESIWVVFSLEKHSYLSHEIMSFNSNSSIVLMKSDLYSCVQGKKNCLLVEAIPSDVNCPKQEGIGRGLIEYGRRLSA